jgi:cytochrome oxidase assembly protein ShyY1
MKTAPNWFSVARQPKWIGGLFLALAAAAICALLAQWQLGRSFEQAATENTQTVAKPIDSLIRPGLPVQPYSVGSLVEANVMLDLTNVFVVSNRVQQNGQPGFWVVANSRNIDGASLTVALGFAPSRHAALAARQQLRTAVQAQAFLPVRGLLGSSEPPQLTTAPDQQIFANPHQDLPAVPDSAATKLGSRGPAAHQGKTRSNRRTGQLAQRVLRHRVGPVLRIQRVPVVASGARRPAFGPSRKGRIGTCHRP